MLRPCGCSCGGRRGSESRRGLLLRGLLFRRKVIETVRGVSDDGLKVVAPASGEERVRVGLPVKPRRQAGWRAIRRGRGVDAMLHLSPSYALPSPQPRATREMRSRGSTGGSTRRANPAHPVTPEQAASRHEIPATRANPAWSRGLQVFQGVEPQGPYGIRTRAAAVRGRCPRPLDEWAVATAKCSERALGASAAAGQAVAEDGGTSAGSGSRASIRSSKRRRISSPVASRS